jgi:hypothetical protein
MPVRASVEVLPLPPSVGICLPVPMTGIAPETAGLVCTATIGTGCKPGDVCVPNVGPARACIEHAGQVACPEMTLTQIIVAAKFDDTRGCTTCTCNATTSGVTCENAMLTLYTDPACAVPAAVAPVPADDKCHVVSNLQSVQSVEYSATPSGVGCAPSSTTPTGGETPIGTQTLCCL